MKKFLLLLATALVACTASAANPVKTLYEGEAKEVTWETPLNIAADQFADGVNVGDYIYITFSQTTDVIEIKANGTWLPGSILTNLGDNTTDFKAYITEDMLDTLRQYGLEIIGAKFTVTGVSIQNDGFNMPEGAVWGGYFWVDNWKTLEIFKTAFASHSNARYMDIYLSDDNAADFTGYFLKVLTRWDPETVLAANDQIEHGPRVATVDLDNINLNDALADVNALMIQGNQESGKPFNITAVALRGEKTGIEGIVAGNSANVSVYNLQGVLVRENVPAAEATAGLPAGLYIAGGRKVVVK